MCTIADDADAIPAYFLRVNTYAGSTLHLLDAFSTLLRTGGDVRLYLTRIGKGLTGPVSAAYRALMIATIESVCDVSPRLTRHLGLANRTRTSIGNRAGRK